MIFPEIRLGLLLFFLSAAAYTDYKERIVPDWLSYVLIILGVSFSLIDFDLNALLLGTAVFIIGLLTYFTGVFGGGDVKMFVGMALIVPFYAGKIFILNILILSALFTLAFYSVYYSVKLLLKKKISLKDSKREILIAVILSLLLVFNFFLLQRFFPLQQLLILFVPLAASIPFIILQKQIKQEFFLKKVKIRDLEEDEVIALDFLPKTFPEKLRKNFLLKKIITGSDKKLLEKNHVKEVLVLRQMPAFMPMVLLAAITFAVNPDVFSSILVF